MDITDAPAEHRDETIRRASWTALTLLVPVVVGAGLLALGTARGSGCATHGVECADVPDGSIPASFLAALLLGVLAVAWPRKLLPFASARGWLLGLHGAAQLTTAALILGLD
ncbi:hypothetical protein ACFVFH_00405 [Streptomyces sp. NPDC057697]|uniref:hypothetical protein n=1 Tax=Streptomyces sp. NPDC057697 TaxID=3346219 RepID=UPI0036BBCA50